MKNENKWIQGWESRGETDDMCKESEARDTNVLRSSLKPMHYTRVSSIYFKSFIFFLQPQLLKEWR